MPSSTSSPWLVPVVALGLFVTVLLRPIHDVDIFWQLKLGEMQIDNRGPVNFELFLAPKLGEPSVPMYWLGQVVYATVHWLGGWRLLHSFDAVLWFGGFLIVLSGYRQRPAVAQIVALVLGFLAAIPFASLRPQSAAVLAFGLLVRLVQARFSVGKSLLLGIPLFVVWQNFHPSVIVAAFYLVAVTMAGLVKTAFRRAPKPWPTVALMLAAGAATVATPAGFSLIELSRVNSSLSVLMRTPEWLPMTAMENRTNAVGPALTMIVILLLAIRFRNRVRLESLIPALLFAGLSVFFAFRFVLFLGMVSIPLIAELLTPQNHFPEQTSRSRSTWLQILGLMIVGTLIPARFAEYYPFDAIEELQTSKESGTVYCHHAWGSLIPYFCDPKWHATHDGRFYLHTRDEWMQYQRAANGEIPVDSLVPQFQIKAFLLRPGTDDGLIELLKANPNWKEQFRDSNAALFLPLFLPLP